MGSDFWLCSLRVCFLLNLLLLKTVLGGGGGMLLHLGPPPSAHISLSL